MTFMRSLHGILTESTPLHNIPKEVSCIGPIFCSKNWRMLAWRLWVTWFAGVGFVLSLATSVGCVHQRDSTVSAQNETRCQWAGTTSRANYSKSGKYVVLVVARSDLKLIPARTTLWNGVGLTPIWIAQALHERQEMMRQSSLVKSLGGVLLFLPSLHSLHSEATCAGIPYRAVVATLAAGLLRIGGEQNDTIFVPSNGDSLALLLASHHRHSPWASDEEPLESPQLPYQVVINAHHYGFTASTRVWQNVVRREQLEDELDFEGSRGLLSILDISSHICNTSQQTNTSILSPAFLAMLKRYPWHRKHPAMSYARLRQHLAVLPTDAGALRLLDTHYTPHVVAPDRVFWFVVTTLRNSTGKQQRIDACKETWLDEDVHIITRERIANHPVEKVLSILPSDIDYLPKKEQVTKFFSVWDYLFKTYLDDYDWFVKVDDDTYLRKDYFYYDLVKVSAQFAHQPLWRGERYCKGNSSCFCLGAAYALNQAALRLLGPSLSRCKESFNSLHLEDMALGLCLDQVGVPTCEPNYMVINTLSERRHSPEEWMWYHKVNPTLMHSLYACDRFGLFG